MNFPIPIIGFCAWSGTGKTTLLTQLIPILTARSLRVGLVKHAHHQFAIDHPNKDSYRLREAGASQVLVASRKCKALIAERPDTSQEPTLEEALEVINPAELDVVLVEGFKKESFPKIELHRPSLGRPLLFPEDSNVIAIASDAPLAVETGSRPLLDLNQPAQIADFIVGQLDEIHDGRKKTG
jgi:molybdopterin-guanine dinucleotide biosynthesis protein B